MCKLFPKSIRNHIKWNIGILDHATFLKKLKKDKFYPETIIDIGANQGEFSELGRNIYPDSKILMIEPNENHIEVLIIKH